VIVCVSLYLAVRAHVTPAAVLLLGPILVGPVISVMIRGSLLVTLFFLALSVFIASLVLKPWQVLVTGIAAMVGLGIAIVRVPPNAVDGALRPNLVVGPALMVLMVSLFGYLGARANSAALEASRRSQEEADAAWHSLEQANTTLEADVSARTAELRQALADLGTRAAAQEELFAEVMAQREAIREMSVPVLPVSASTLVMPLIGALDSRRLHELQTQALGSVEQTRARRLILDITGVPVVDTQVARGLVETILAVRLLGADAILVGIRPEVAQTLVGLGVELEGVQTAATLQQALSRG
jgi:rsbT co-antagonist protein RsbR